MSCFQMASLQQLEIENQEAAKKLENVVEKGEALLQQIEQALHAIAQAQLQSQALENGQWDGRNHPGWLLMETSMLQARPVTKVAYSGPETGMIWYPD